jgi:hypothetical protein
MAMGGPKIVYYDKDVISLTDVRRASRVSGADAFHIRPNDALWPDGSAVEAETIWSQREYRFREELMDCFEELKHLAGPMIYQGVDLLEAIRYDWIFAVEEAYHRCWAILKLVRKYHPQSIHWITNRPAFVAAAQDTSLLANTIFTHDVRAVRRTSVWAAQQLNRIRLWVWLWRQERQMRRRIEKQPSNSSPTDAVVFAEYYPNSAKLTLRVADAIERLSDEPTAFFGGRPSVCDLIAANGRKCSIMDTLSSRPESSTALKATFAQFANAVAAQCHNPTSAAAKHVDAPRSIAAIKPVRREVVQQTQELLQAAVGWVDAFRDLIVKNRPRALVTTTYSGTFGRALALVAETCDVPSIYIQHGVLAKTRFFRHFPHSKVLLWGEGNMCALNRLGIPRERMAVVGAPIYDELARTQRVTGASSGSNQSNVGPRILLLGSRPGGSVVNTALFERILRATLNVVQAIPSAVLTVKLHPSDRTQIAETVLRNIERVVLERESSLRELLLDSDVAIVTSSTAGLEACALDRPLVQFDPTGSETVVDYHSYGAAIAVTSESDLGVAIHDALWNDSVRAKLAVGRRQLVDDLLDGARGDATRRAAEEILEIVGSLSK